MELRSTPSKINSYNGDISRKRATFFVKMSMVKSTSSTVVNRPIPNRMEVCAKSSPTPIARKTYEGSNDAEVQAEPLYTAMFFSAINSDSPSTYANEMFKHPSYRAC